MILALWFYRKETSDTLQKANQVIVFGFDQIGPDELQNAETPNLASEYLRRKKLDFFIIYFVYEDYESHEFDHRSKEYYSEEKPDGHLAEVITAINEAGMTKENVVVVRADHGGLGKGHSSESLNEMEIPYIVGCKFVKKNNKLTYPVFQYGNALNSRPRLKA